MSEIEKAAQRMFGPGGMGVTNFNMFPGEHLSTPEQRAKAINDMLDALERGEFTESTFDDRSLIEE